MSTLLFLTYRINTNANDRVDALMQTIVFIGSNKFGTSKEVLLIAKEMGYYVVLFKERTKYQENNESYFPEVDQFIYLDNLLDEKLVIEEITNLKEKGIQICACVSLIDPYVSCAARLSKQLGLAQISAESLGLMENKITIREKLNEDPMSPFYTIFRPEDSLQELEKKYKSLFPVIIKPPISNGSKDVLFVETSEKLAKVIKLIQKKYPNSPVLIEEFLLGPQYLVEVLVYNSEIKFFGVVEQEVIYNGRFIVIGYSFPSTIETEDYQNLYACILRIIEQTGLSNGSCHVEMKLVQGEWKLIEINPRMSGGVMNRIIEEGIGINLVKEILNIYLGKEPTFSEMRKQQYVYARYLTIGTRGRLLKVTGKERALIQDGIKYVYIKPLEGRILTDPYTMGNRYACIIAVSEQAEQAAAIALEAAKEIKFYLEPL